MQKVGIYLRLSNEDSDKKDNCSESIKNQRNMLKQYLNNHPEFILFDEYCDEDLSGAGTYRPEFERLIKDCEKHKIDVVLCKSQSRFSRDMEIIEKYLHNKFKEWHIRFIGLADNADTNSIGNKKARQINGLVNEWFLEDVSNNIRSALSSKMQQGELIAPFAPFGYDISKENNNKLVIDPIASQIVKQIFNLYLKGFGYTNIANYLNKQDIPCPSKYKYQKKIKLNVVSTKPRELIKWNPNAIKNILQNEVYIGNLVQGKRTTVSYKNHHIYKKDSQKWIRVLNTHDNIIDESTFISVQKLIHERTKPLKKTGMVHLFSGKVYCENNHLLRKKNSSKYTYLTCEYHKLSIRYDELSSIVLLSINKLVKKYYDKNIILEIESHSKEINILEQQILLIKKKINKSDFYLQSLYEDKVQKLIDTEQFRILITQYNEEKQLYEKELQNLYQKINNYRKKIDTIYTYHPFKSLNKIIVDEFVDKIYLFKDKTIKIIWNF